MVIDKGSVFLWVCSAASVVKNNQEVIAVNLGYTPKFSAMKKAAATTREHKKAINPNKEELKTDPPLSEKDEFKEAERRTNTAAKQQ